MTAVEQFIEQLEKQGDSWENVSIGRIQISIKVEDYIELQRQAKEMEKERIIKTYEVGISRGTYYDEDVYHKNNWRSGEKYYNETFKP